MTDKNEAGYGYPLVIKPDCISGPSWLMPWVSMVERNHLGSVSPTTEAAEIINSLLATNWLPPNAPAAAAAAKSKAEGDALAHAIVGLLLQSLDCADAEKEALQQKILHKLQQYKETL